MTEPASQLIDPEGIARYLEAHLPGFSGPVWVEKFASGQSNPTFRLETPGGRYVLRRKPPGQLLKSAHAVDREFRVMRALAGSRVPVPRVHLLCEDETVIGSMFLVMELVEGRHFGDPRVPEVDNRERSAIYDDMNRVLAALHDIDVEAVGLADFGRAGNYFARQVARWSQQYRASATREIVDMDRLIAWLEAATPEDDGRIGLVHGDYRIDNMIFRAEAPRIAAVIDWELSTIGHPFADLAFQCMQWRMPVGPEGRGLEGVDRASLGIPSESDYVARYCERRGIDGIANWEFYLAFSFFRLAAIMEGVLRRALEGNASNPEQARRLGSAVPLMAQKAMAIVEHGA
ncbi:MAG: phosphotransferase [Rhizobiales bacterium]|nr:phosphotransferase [Hyphomicrobiales bacterium]